MNGTATDSLILLLTVPGDAGLSGLLAAVDLEMTSQKAEFIGPLRVASANHIQRGASFLFRCYHGHV